MPAAIRRREREEITRPLYENARRAYGDGRKGGPAACRPAPGEAPIELQQAVCWHSPAAKRQVEPLTFPQRPNEEQPLFGQD